MRTKKQKFFGSFFQKRTFFLLLFPFSASASPFLPPKVVLIGAPEKFQYMYVDSAGHRLFVTHGDKITVIDTDRLAVSGQVNGLDGAHGVALVPGGDGYADSGRAATATVFDTHDDHVVATLKAGVDAYAVTYDPASKNVFVMNDDDGTITVIDPGKRRVSATITASPGFEQSEADGHGHLYIAHSEAHQVLRIDTAKNAVDAAWPVPDCNQPHGLALDNAAHRVFVGCQDGALKVLDMEDGRLVATLPTGLGADVVLFDAARHRILVPDATGTLTVIDQRGPDAYAAEPRFATAPGARTGALDPATGRLFLVTAQVAHTIAPKHQGGAPRYAFVPGSARVLVFDPAR